MPKGQTRVDLVETGDRQADLGVIGADAAAGVAPGQRVAELAHQKARGLGVQRL